MKAIKIEDVFEEVDHLGEGGGTWNVYSVSAKMEDGTFQLGTCQGDGDHMWSLETFEQE